MTIVDNLAKARTKVEALLGDTVILERDRPGVADDILDVATGALVPPDPDRTRLWIGPAAVLADREDGTYRVLLPLAAPLLEVGDEIVVSASGNDAQLVGRRVRVRGVPRGGTFAVVRIVHCEAV